MSYWNPIIAVLNARHRAASHEFTENSTAFLGRALIGVIVGFVAWNVNGALGASWAGLSAPIAKTQLNRLWLNLQLFWIAAIMLPGAVALLGRNPARETLRAFPIKFSQILAADLLASILDTPTLIVGLASFRFLWELGLHGHLQTAVAAFLALLSLGTLTAALVQLLIAGGGLLAGRVRRWSQIPAATALMLFGLCVCVPPAFASLTTSPNPQIDAVRAYLPTVSIIDPTSSLPSSFACDAVLAVSANEPARAMGSFGVLITMTLIAVGGAVTTSRFANAAIDGGGGLAAARKSRSAGEVRDRLGSKIGSKSASQLLALIAADWRLLLRNPGTYLPLRQPAAILLLGLLGFLAPDMGKDPVYSLKEFLGIGGIIYNALWQMQLICNRFGSESRTAAILFSFSVSRRRLLLAKNVSLLLLLLVLDGPALAALCVVGKAPYNIPTFLLWLPLILTLLTSFGNIFTALQPFAIARINGEHSGTATDGLAFGYACVGTATGFLMTPINSLLNSGWLGIMAGLSLTLGIYWISLIFASDWINKNEPTMIAQLDRNGQ